MIVLEEGLKLDPFNPHMKAQLEVATQGSLADLLEGLLLLIGPPRTVPLEPRKFEQSKMLSIVDTNRSGWVPSFVMLTVLFLLLLNYSP